MLEYVQFFHFWVFFSSFLLCRYKFFCWISFRIFSTFCTNLNQFRIIIKIYVSFSLYFLLFHHPSVLMNNESIVVRVSTYVFCVCVRVSASDYSTNYDLAPSNNSARAKSKLGFLENLNAKLAEQRLSGKAFAVRNIINSKALVSMDVKDGGRRWENKNILDFLPHNFLFFFFAIVCWFVDCSVLSVSYFVIIFSNFYFIFHETRVEEKRW